MRQLVSLPSVLLGAGLALNLGACAATGSATRPDTGASASSSGNSSVDDGTGASAPDFSLRDVNGQDVRLSDFAGKVVLIDFWATWCVPCEAAIPHLQEMYERHKDEGLVILGVSMDGPETMALVAPFVQRYRLTFPVLLDEETRVTSLLNPKRAAPLQVYVDRQGRIARVRQGYTPGDEKFIEDDVVRLLAAQ